MLGISRMTLYNKVKAYALNVKKIDNRNAGTYGLDANKVDNEEADHIDRV